jgi:hypothetical protein
MPEAQDFQKTPTGVDTDNGSSQDYGEKNQDGPIQEGVNNGLSFYSILIAPQDNEKSQTNMGGRYGEWKT